MVCDKERWCVTKLCVKDGLCVCVKDGVWQSGVWKMVCVCVWKLCGKESVWQSCVWKMMCDKVVCERWSVKDAVWKRVCDKVVCDKDGVWQKGCVKDGVWKRVCASQSAPGDQPRQARHQSQPSATSATPATQLEGQCHQVPCLPANGRSMSPSATPATQSATVKDGVWQSGVWKMVCDKVVCERWCVAKRVCERWCVTKLCVKDSVSKMICVCVWQSCVWKMVCQRWRMCVCDKVVCERWCVTKLCVKDGVCVCMWKMVCDKVVCETCRVTKWCVWSRWCVKDGVWQSCVWKDCVCVTKWCVKEDVCVCDKVVWKRVCVCVTKLCVKDGVWKRVCDKVVCVWQSCVWKRVCDKVCVKEGVWQSCVRKKRGRRRRRRRVGYRIKDKSPTQRCGEQPPNLKAATDIEVEHGGEHAATARREQALQQHAWRRMSLDDVPMQLKRPRTEQGPHGVFMAKHAISEKGMEKQLEKEQPWRMILPDECEAYREAKMKLWEQHAQLGAVRPLSAEGSEQVLQRIDPSRVLTRTRTLPSASQTQKFHWKLKRGYVLLGRRTPTCKGKVGMIDRCSDHFKTLHHLGSFACEPKSPSQT